MHIKLKKLEGQDGLVSIVVTLFIMSILTLIAIGFANSAQREQRQALDQQLSTQAFYAAESGVNETVKAIRDAEAADLPLPDDLNDCENPESLGDDDTVSNTCIIADTEALDNLQYDVTISSSTLAQIEPDAPMSTLTISWQDKDGGRYFAPASDCSNTLKSEAEWKTYGIPPGTPDGEDKNTGVIRAMLIPRTDFLTRAQLVRKTHTFLLYPSADGCPGPDTVSVVKEGSDANTKGGIYNGKCNTTRTTGYCSVNIKLTASDLTTPDPILPGQKYVLRLKSIYRNSSTIVTGQSSDGTTVKFVNGQIEIESAGKANDVLRTVKVRIPFTTTTYSGGIYPESTIESENSFCKLLEVYTDAGVRKVRSTEPDPADGPCAI